MSTIRRIARNRTTAADQRGFYADLIQAGSTPQVSTDIDLVRPVPPGVADLLGVEAGSPVLARARHMAADGEPLQLATSYFPPAVVARLPILAEANTGHGGMYQRMEDAGHRIHQVDIVGGRTATNAEVTALALDAPFVLTITRVTRDAETGAILEVGDLALAPGRQELVFEV